MNCYYRLLTFSLVSIVMLGLSSCSSSPTSTKPTPTSNRSPTPAVTPSSSVRSLPNKTTPIPAAPQSPRSAITRTTTVNVYTIDSQCLKLIPTKATVNAKQPMQGAIAKILADIDSADFSVSSYRISQQGNVATVELRPAIGSKRGFHSLSACEQMALFGSIQKTLISNTQWRIKSVRFTENGKELLL